MFEFMEIVSGVVRIVTFQSDHRPGHRPPARERRRSHEAIGYEWDEHRRR